MTTTDMIIRVRQGVRELDSYVKGSLFKEEILLQLNIAQNQYQYEAYLEKDNNLKRFVDIRTTQKIESITATTPATSKVKNAKEYLFPSDFNFLEDNTLLSVGSNTKPVDFVVKNEIENFIETPENIPIVRTPKAFIENNRVVVIHDPFETVGQLHLSYFRKLVTITELVACELPDHTHDKVCELAIMNIIGKRNPETYQIARDLNQTKL